MLNVEFTLVCFRSIVLSRLFKQDAHTRFPGRMSVEQAQQDLSSAWAGDEDLSEEESLLLCLRLDLLFLEAF